MAFRCCHLEKNYLEHTRWLELNSTFLMIQLNSWAHFDNVWNTSFANFEPLALFCVLSRSTSSLRQMGKSVISRRGWNAFGSRLRPRHINAPAITCRNDLWLLNLMRVRSQSVQPVQQFTTARSNYATTSQCGFRLRIYLGVKKGNSMHIGSWQ